jgi:hypothetical protein
LHKLGINNVSTLKREGVTIGIGYVEDWLPKILVNLGTTGEFSRKIRIYRKKFNSTTGDYIGADHKSQSHIADMMRYMCTALQYYFNEKGEFLLTLDDNQTEYQSELANVTFVSV